MKTKKITNLGLLIFALLIMLCATSTSWATTYYVSKSGSDSNNGTATTTPFLTIKKGLSLVSAGDTINIMAGTYYEALVLQNTGTSSAPITVQNYNGASVTINSGTLRAISLGKTNGAINYYTFKGLTLISTYQSSYSGNVNSGYRYSIDFSSGSWWGVGAPLDSAQPTSGNNGFVLSNCNITGAICFMGHNNTVTGCTINGNGQWSDGIYDSQIVSHHNTITYNKMFGFTNRAVWSHSNTSYNTVSYNTIYNCGSNGNGGSIDFDGAYLPVTNCVANYNTIYNCTSSGNIGIQFENGFNGSAIGNNIYNCTNGIIVINYGLSGGHISYKEYRTVNTGVTIANNIFSNITSSAIALIQAPGNFIYNNTIYKGSGSGRFAIDMTNLGSTEFTSGGNIIQNNIIANSAGGIQALTANGSAPNTIQNNLFYGNASNGTTGTNVVTGNPSFVGPTLAVPNLAIQQGSAAIDTGRTISAVTKDVIGTQRPQGSAYDIGAYELSATGTVQLPPPTNLKVL